MLTMNNITEVTIDTENMTILDRPNSLDFVHYIFNVLGIVITMATLIGNTLVILAVITEKKLRKVGNVFIINLALSDCLVGLFVSPLAIFYDIRGVWVLGGAMCDFWVSMDVICCTASILNLCAISYDRSNAIIHPIRYSRHRTFPRAWTIVAIIWIYSTLIALPPFLGLQSSDDDMYSNKICHVNRERWYTLFSTIGAFYLPTCFMTYFYLKIYRVTRSKRHKILRCCKLTSSESCDTHESAQTDDSQQSPCYSHMCFPLCSDASVKRPTIITQTSIDTSENIASGAGRTDKLDEQDEKEIRRESIEPELLAIYQIRRQRSRRNCSTVTESSFGSTFMSFSTDSSNTATTSFSESSDRSSSISTECSGRSFSVTSETGGRRYSTLRSHRLSSARRSSLKTEVIHELVAAHTEQTEEQETERPVETASCSKSPVKRCDTDEGNDEESDEAHYRQRTKKLKSSTFRQRNSRKRRRIALSQEKRAAKTLGIVMGCFIACWLPFFIVAILRPFCPQCYIHPLIEKTVVWLGYFNSACNPFIYSFFNKDFRHAFKGMTCARPAHVVHL